MRWNEGGITLLWDRFITKVENRFDISFPQWFKYAHLRLRIYSHRGYLLTAFRLYNSLSPEWTRSSR